MTEYLGHAGHVNVWHGRVAGIPTTRPGSTVDPAHIGIWGSSAGGHLAALAGVTGDLPEMEGTSGSAGYSSRVQAVALASAPSDFLHAGGQMSAGAEAPHHPVTQLFGGTVAERADLMHLASPIYHLHGGTPPFLIAHGTLDETRHPIPPA